jgi:hypothetical protein
LVYINHPKLFNELELVKNITRYGKIYIPKEVLHINIQKPWETTFCWNSLPKKVMVEVYEEEDQGESAELEEGDEEDLASQSQLVLTKRIFYRAFKGQAVAIMELLNKMGPVMEIHMMPTNSFVMPLWETKSQIIAANIINAFFDDVFEVIGVPHLQRKSFFDSMKQAKFSSPEIITQSQAVLGSKFVATIFPMEICSAPQSILECPYFKKWLAVDSVLATLNKYDICIV